MLLLYLLHLRDDLVCLHVLLRQLVMDGLLEILQIGVQHLEVEMIFTFIPTAM